MIDDLKRLIKHSSIYSIGNALMRAGSFVLLPLYTHFLTVEEYGILELSYSVSSIVSTFLSIGLAHATLRFYFEYDDIRDRNATVTTAFMASLIITIPSVLLLSLLNIELSELLFDTDIYVMTLKLTYIILVLEMARQIGLAYMRAKEYSGLFVLVCLSQLVVQVGCNIYTVGILKAGINGVLIGNLISIFVGLIICTYIIIRECGFRFDFKKLKDMLLYSYPFLFTAISGSILQNADRFILKSFLSVEAVGIYALAQKFGMLLKELVIEPFQRSFGAFRFSVMKQDNAAEIQSRSLNYLIFIVGWVALGISLFSVDVINIMTTSNFYPTSNYIPIILLANTIACCGYVFQTGILYKKKTIVLFYISFFSSLFGLAIAFVLIRQFGLYGACISVVCQYLVNINLMNHFSQKLFRVHYEYFKIASLLFVAVVSFLVGFFIPVNNIILAISLKAIIWILFPFLIIKTRFFTDEEIHIAMGYLKKFKRKKIA